jgi:hypothetical protein
LTPPPPLAVSDVTGMNIERLRAVEIMWACTSRGRGTDAYATAIATLTIVPSSPPVDLRPAAIGSDHGQTSTDSVASVYRQPTVDSRPMTTEPVRSQSRIDRYARRRNVSARPPKSQEQSTATTTRVRSHLNIISSDLFICFVLCVCVCVSAMAPKLYLTLPIFQILR